MNLPSFNNLKLNLKTCQILVVQKLKQSSYLKSLNFSDTNRHLICLNWSYTSEFEIDSN